MVQRMRGREMQAGRGGGGCISQAQGSAQRDSTCIYLQPATAA
jgi:hypothetical protein